jgi:hypothetical protein
MTASMPAARSSDTVFAPLSPEVVDDEMRGTMRVEFRNPCFDFLLMEVSDKHDRFDAHRQEMTNHIASRSGGKHFDQRCEAAGPKHALERRKLSDTGRRCEILHADADHRSAFALQVQRVGVRREPGFRKRELDAIDRFLLQAGLPVQYA